MKVPSALEEVILSLLASEGKLYGLQIQKVIQERSEGAVRVDYGSLYPTLNRLEKKGYVSSDWGEGSGARRRYYEIVQAGREALEQKRSLRRRIESLL